MPLKIDIHLQLKNIEIAECYGSAATQFARISYDISKMIDGWNNLFDNLENEIGYNTDVDLAYRNKLIEINRKLKQHWFFKFLPPCLFYRYLLNSTSILIYFLCIYFTIKWGLLNLLQNITNY